MTAARVLAKAGLLDRPRRRMNGTEAAYALVLEARKRAGEIAEYHFEGVTLLLGFDTRYTPDFLVVLATGECELHECKGHWRDDAKVKANVCARLYPFRVRVVRRNGKGWTSEEIQP